MKRLTLACDFWVPASLDEVWDFASQPKNLALISPPDYNVSVDYDGKINEGSRITIHLEPPGLPFEMKWISVVQNVVSSGAKREFTDVQQEGLFAFWKHTHTMIAGSEAIISTRTQKPVKCKQPGTWIQDRVQYSMPLGPLGAVVHKYFAQNQLAQMFAYRRQKIVEKFSSV